MVIFFDDLGVGNATMLAQGLMEFVEQFQEKQGNNIISSCRIDLPFPVKSDFDEDVITFANNSTTLYLLRFCASNRNFTPKSTRLRVHKVAEENEIQNSTSTVLKLRLRSE